MSKISNSKKVLVFNAGSSSLKFELFEARDTSLRASAKQSGLLRRYAPRNDVTSLFEGNFENHGKPIHNFEKAIKKAIASLGKFFDKAALRAVGHRVVHGGEKYTKPARITPAVIREIRKLAPLAPLHNPANLACIKACLKIFGRGVPQVAVFDTAFHHTMPERAFLYGLPEKLAKKLGIRRYGFHGTSHQFVFEQARKKLGKAKMRRTITCHLGNGCSLAAILNGKVIDTSMGFTPLEGIPMGTRSGDIDPGVIFTLLEKGLSAREVKKIITERSGLLGVSEFSGDMRDLWAAYHGGTATNKRKKARASARRALDWFSYRIAKYIGAYAAALGGLDCIVFTGGMGEHAYYLRRWVMQYVKKIAQPKVLIIPTDEEKKIAEETLRQI